MTDLATSQSKLRSSPTGGVAGEHSGLFRRLLGAGYKGYLQGMLAGAGIDGAFGLGVGAVVGLAFAIPTAGQSLWLIPALGGVGAVYGAHTFADIAKTSAIIAESQQFNEHRRALLERYYDTPSEAEAAEIKRQLEEELKPKKPEKVFHWRTVLIGAAIGAAVLGGLALAGYGLHIEAFTHLFEAVKAVLPESFHGVAGMSAVMASVGAVAGSLIGLDREYIRQWLDHSESLLHDRGRIEKEMMEHEVNINRIAEAARSDTPAALLAKTPPPTHAHTHVDHRVEASIVSDPAAPLASVAARVDAPSLPTNPPALASAVPPIPPDALAPLPVSPTMKVEKVHSHQRLCEPLMAQAI